VTFIIETERGCSHRKR